MRELAGVIAHEIAHITKRHGIKRLVAQHTVSVVLNLFISEESQLTRFVANATASMAFLQYGHIDEFEADQFAVEYSILSGYNPRGMQTFLGTLQELGGAEYGPIAKYFSTHPSTSERIAKVKAQIDSKGQNLDESLLYKERFEAIKAAL